MNANQRSIPCHCDPLVGSLTPNMGIDQSITNAVIDIHDDQFGGKSGTLSFGGVVKAFLTCDDTGRVIGYTLTDFDANTQSSVENILRTM